MYAYDTWCSILRPAAETATFCLGAGQGQQEGGAHLSFSENVAGCFDVCDAFVVFGVDDFDVGSSHRQEANSRHLPRNPTALSTLLVFRPSAADIYVIPCIAWSLLFR